MKKLAIALVFTLLLGVGSVFASARQNTNSSTMGNTNAGGSTGMRRHHRRHRGHMRRHHRRGRKKAANTNT
jgi:hypothetical protein